MLKSILCDYRDAFMLVEGTITITGHGDDIVKGADERIKDIIFKSYAQFKRMNNWNIQ